MDVATLQAKRAEYQAELEKAQQIALQHQQLVLRLQGAIVAMDELIELARQAASKETP